MKTWAGNFTLGISSLMHTLGIRVPTPQGSSEDKRGNAGPSPTVQQLHTRERAWLCPVHDASPQRRPVSNLSSGFLICKMVILISTLHSYYRDNSHKVLYIGPGTDRMLKTW